jgi:hypothetical protein
MPMHYLPLTLFRSKDHRNPQSGWGEVLPSAKLDLLTRIAGKIEHKEICENLLDWLREYESQGQGVTNVLNVMENELSRRGGARGPQLVPDP